MSRITTAMSGLCDISEPKRNKLISLEKKDIAKTIEILLSLQSGNIGFIFNTVRNATNTSDFIENTIPHAKVYLYHAQFTVAQRNVSSLRLLKQVGNEASSPAEGLNIFVGTQVLEQSLDIDFDLLCTEIAPIDLILQRIGRLHRHSYKKRPNGLTAPKCIIIDDSEIINPKGSRIIYGDYLLDTASKIVDKHKEINLPDDIKKLIEISYDIPQESESPYQDIELAQQYQMGVKRKHQNASVFQIPNPENINNLYGWLDCSTTNEHQAEAKVREGVSGPELILLIKDSEDNQIKYYGHDGKLKALPDETPNYYQINDIMQSSIRFPMYMNSEDFILAVEKEYTSSSFFTHWQETSLDGELPIILNINTKKTYANWTISYNESTGLQVTRHYEQ